MSVNAGNRNVADNYRNRMLNVIILAEDLFEYMMTITSNEKKFEPKYDRIFKDKFQDLSCSIYISLVDANEIYVGYDDFQRNVDNFKERDRLQQKARRDCKKLLHLVSRSRKFYKMRGKRYSNLTKKIIVLGSAISKWNESDRIRCNSIIEKKRKNR